MSTLNPVNKSYCLHKVCESNFQKLLRLAPNLFLIDDLATALIDGIPTLYLRIIERQPYTLTIELTHCFDREMEKFFEPALKIRVYLDAKSAEVLHDHSRPHIVQILKKKSDFEEILDHKWSINYFLEKWLNHCLQLGYSFDREKSVEYEVI